MKLRSTLVIILVAALSSCKQKQRFDKKAWQSGSIDDHMFGIAARKTMVDDLVKNYPLIGCDSAQIIQILGSPDVADSAHLTYEMDIEYDGIGPSYIQSFQVALQNGKAVGTKVSTWRHGQPEE